MANGRDPGAPIAQELYAGFDQKVSHIVLFGAAQLQTGQGDQADPCPKLKVPHLTPRKSW